MCSWQKPPKERKEGRRARDSQARQEQDRPRQLGGGYILRGVALRAENLLETSRPVNLPNAEECVVISA